MNEVKHHRIILWRLVLLLFAASIMFFNLIPFTLAPTALPMPDILFCVTCALIIRRPEVVPFWLIFLIYFSFDIFLTRPLGVWTACVLISTEVLRANRDAFMENLFPFEWFYVSLMFPITLMLNQIILIVAFTPTPTFANMAWEFIFTVPPYPLIVFIITYMLRIKKPALGAFGVKGHKA